MVLTITKDEMVDELVRLGVAMYGPDGAPREKESILKDIDKFWENLSYYEKLYIIVFILPEIQKEENK